MSRAALPAGLGAVASHDDSGLATAIVVSAVMMMDVPVRKSRKVAHQEAYFQKRPR